MPVTKDVGTPSENNKRIGCVPTLHYFEIGSKGRGEVLRLFFEDAGIAFKDIRYPFESWPEEQKTMKHLNPTLQLPILDLNGKIMTQSYSIMRYFARLLKEYDGNSSDEMFWTDAMCDTIIDWRTEFVQAYFCPEKDEKYPEFCKGQRARYLSGLEERLNASAYKDAGPLVLGDRFSYADIVIYQQLHDDGLTADDCAGLKDHPLTSKLVKAVLARPGIAAYLKSDRYKG